MSLVSCVISSLKRGQCLKTVFAYICLASLSVSCSRCLAFLHLHTRMLLNQGWIMLNLTMVLVKMQYFFFYKIWQMKSHVHFFLEKRPVAEINRLQSVVSKQSSMAPPVLIFPTMVTLGIWLIWMSRYLSKVQIKMVTCNNYLGIHIETEKKNPHLFPYIIIHFSTRTCSFLSLFMRIKIDFSLFFLKCQDKLGKTKQNGLEHCTKEP